MGSQRHGHAILRKETDKRLQQKRGLRAPFCLEWGKTKKGGQQNPVDARHGWCHWDVKKCEDRVVHVVWGEESRATSQAGHIALKILSTLRVRSVVLFSVGGSCLGRAHPMAECEHVADRRLGDSPLVIRYKLQFY